MRCDSQKTDCFYHDYKIKTMNEASDINPLAGFAICRRAARYVLTHAICPAARGELIPYGKREMIMKNKNLLFLLSIVLVFMIGVLLGYFVGRPAKKAQIAETTEETTEQSLYTSYATLYVHTQATVSNENMSISSSDLATSQNLTQTYISIFQSKTVQEEISKEVNKAYPDAEYALSMDSEAEAILKLSVTGEDPAHLADICQIAIDVFQEKILNVIEGSTLKIIDLPTDPEIAD